MGENSSSPYDVPNRIVGPACTHLTNPGNPSQYINLACYSFSDFANLLGNAGRNSLVGPGLAELDYNGRAGRNILGIAIDQPFIQREHDVVLDLADGNLRVQIARFRGMPFRVIPRRL